MEVVERLFLEATSAVNRAECSALCSPGSRESPCSE